MSKAPPFVGAPLAMGLAPMAGFTDAPMRRLARRAGACLTMTEVANAAAIARACRRTLQLLETFPGEGVVGAHIYGRDPVEMAEAARRIEALGRFAFIDINAGCPVRKIVAKGCGAALMADAPRLAAIVAAVRAAVALPVTVKTRLGLTPDRETAGEVAAAVADAGAAALWVHGRYASARHGGPVDWAAVARLQTRVRLPVWGNGSVTSRTEAADCIRRYGLAGVLVGRAAIGNPWVFADGPGPAIADRMATIEEHLQGLIALKTLERNYRRRGSLDPEVAACMRFRPHLLKYVQGLPGARMLRRRLNDLPSVAAVMAAVRDARAWVPDRG